jgi:hypothetical protein
MDLFDYLRKGKINTFEEPFSVDVRDGPSPFHGLLGMKKKLDNVTAAKFSDTTIWTCLGGVYRLVRSDPTIAVVGNWVLGRPLFWVDKSLYKVTPVVADSTAEYAGQALGGLTTAGSFKIIQTDGEAPVLLAAALTKAAPAINDPIVLKFAANLATGDVELDATAFSNAIIKRLIGYLDEAAVANTVKRVMLTNAHQVQNRGIYT